MGLTATLIRLICKVRRVSIFVECTVCRAYYCISFLAAPPVLCDPPLPPQNGSLVNSPTSDSPLGTVIFFQCDNGLFPMNVLNATCTDKSGNGEWETDPADVVCRVEPGKIEAIKFNLP